VNIEDSTATVTLTAYADSGAVVATEVMNVAANASGYSRQLFSEDIRAANRSGACQRTRLKRSGSGGHCSPRRFIAPKF
jgi:hypothetical protein